MITFDRFNRRTHLYLGLLLVPWVMMYALSSLLISHQAAFRPDAPPKWEPMFERKYERSIPDTADLRPIAYEILRENGLDGAFYHQRPNRNELRVTRHTFFDQVRLTYLIDAKVLRAERQQMPWHQVIIRMHFRGGFGQPSFLIQLWGVVVDITCVAIVIWVITGLIMWWRLARLRLPGALALGAGAASFALFVWML